MVAPFELGVMRPDGRWTIVRPQPSQTMAFAPGVHVFPGGRVDQGHWAAGVVYQGVADRAEQETGDAAVAMLKRNG